MYTRESSRSRTLYAVLLAIILLAGCGGRAEAPVINKSPNRSIPAEVNVKPGESIYEISWRYGLDFLDIAVWNRLKPPYDLKPGQRLALKRGAISKPLATQNTVVSAPLPAPRPSKPVPSRSTSTTSSSTSPAISLPTTPAPSPGTWRWPAKGELVSKYSREKGVNGIRIAGRAGSPVRSTAAGGVVYVGNGLRGYGNLIIVKHSEKYLSAYAYNKKILVNEGQNVAAGEQIAEMGSSGTDRTMLHFEIRVNGKPKDPLKFLKG